VVEKEEKIKLEGDSILIGNLVIEDANTSKILKDIPEDKREDFIKKAIKVGAIGLKNLYLADNLDYVEKEFNNLMKTLEIQSKDIKNNFEREFKEMLKSNELQSKDIRSMIEKTLDVESNSSSLGKMRVLFEDYFDKKKGKISDLLNPFEGDSPIKKLKEEIFKKIQDLRDEIIKEKIKEETSATAKGAKFEDSVFELIGDFCSEYEDKIDFVGGKLGYKNKVGDITIDVEGDENKRIILECKDSSSYLSSSKKTIDEINDAIENRGAKFGIFLFKLQSQIPPALKPMKITNNYIVTSFEDYGLYFAFRVARFFVEKGSQPNQKEIPIDEVQKQLEEMRSKLLDFRNIQTKLTQIDNASGYVRENIERLKKELEGSLDSIRELITRI